MAISLSARKPILGARDARYRCCAKSWAPPLRAAPALALCGTVLRCGLLGLWCGLLMIGQARAEIELPPADRMENFSVSAAQAHRWQEGAYDVWLLGQGVVIEQGHTTARANEAVLWIERADPLSGQPHRILAYLEGNVRIDHHRGAEAHEVAAPSYAAFTGSSWFGRFTSVREPRIQAPVARPEPAVKPNVYSNALRAREPQFLPPPGAVSELPREVRDAAVAPVQFAEPVPAPAATDPAAPPAAGFRRVQVRPRSAVPVQARWFPSPRGSERIAVIENGVNIVVVDAARIGTLDISADRIVIWMGASPSDALSGGSLVSSDTPLELYLEGNIVFRQADRVVYAERMYYNVNRESGIVLVAEMLTPVPEYQGLLRLKADVLRQFDAQRFQAYTAAITSSRLGVPRYWFQAEQVSLEDRQTPLADPWQGETQRDDATGDVAVRHEFLATANNNFVFLGGVPVFFWPTLATDLTKPNVVIDSVRLRNDKVFGTQVLLDWDMYQALGWRNPPEGTEWQLSTDYLSDRGFGLGTNVEYNRQDLFGIPGPYFGFIDAWGIYEQGVDNLGRDRKALVPEEDLRYRVLARHRQRFGDGYQFTSESGLISDRNFLEQYYEQEWDEWKDQTTGFDLKKITENRAWVLSADYRSNEFFTQTEGIRFDHFWLGQSLFDRLTWFEHSHAGYARLSTATVPLDPTDASKFNPLRWEPLDSLAPLTPGNREGLRAATRQELDWPLELGPVKVVPYALGEFAYWGEDLAGAEVDRSYGQLGLRASLPVWRANPEARSLLFNVNGLAHKITFDAEAFWAEASEDVDRFPLYDPLDDDNVEHFRRRYVDDTFAGALMMPDSFLVPLRFDERFYAIRTGLQGNVTSPSTEVVEDLQLARLGIRQRWQTKRGLPGQERIIDWITFDVEGSFFPNADRDNSGSVAGLANYNFEWHVGDRLTLVSDGLFDFFDDGLQVFTLGAYLNRIERMNVYVGYRSLEGPVSSSILAASVGYRLSEKWIVSASGSYDLGEVGNIGQNVRLVRVGESFLASIGFNIDSSRDNVGITFALEPRFLSSSKLGRVGGVQIPPAGAYGLE